GDPVGRTGEYARRLVELPRNRWYHDLPATSIRLPEILDTSTAEVAGDVQSLLQAVRTIGSRRAIVVDISPTDLPVAVVRAIVPEIETLAVNGRIGPRILELFDPFHVQPSRCSTALA
ncbi:MAG: YcaO-like family protein, partial [Vulcanimicrobiaceae bacterium]